MRSRWRWGLVKLKGGEEEGPRGDGKRRESGKEEGRAGVFRVGKKKWVEWSELVNSCRAPWEDEP